MREVNIIFKDVTQTITQGSGENAGICGSIYTESGQSMCKSRCHEIASLMLYIKGYSYQTRTRDWKKRGMQQTTGEKFKEYLRCILASEVLVQVYGQTSDHQEVIKKVKEEMEKTTTTGTQQYEPGVCEDLDYGQAIFGLRGIGPSIKTKLDDWNSGLAGGHAGSARVTGKKCAWPQQDTNQNSAQACNAQEGHVLKDHWLMGKIKEWTDGALYLRVTTLLEQMKAGRMPGGKCAIEKNIKDQIKKVKDTVNPAAAKPAPAKPAPVDNGSPAKPVATSKPATVTPGSGTTTTSSAGGGGGGNPGAAAGKEKGKKGGTGGDCDWKSILEEDRSQVYVLGTYDKEELERMKTVLQQFIHYMENTEDLADALGANCANSGWDDISSHGRYHMGQTVADVVRCRLMTLALHFANGDNVNGKHEAVKRTVTDAKEHRLRCEVANTFGYILEKKYCDLKTPWKRGIKYAWKTVLKMGDQGGLPSDGPVMKRICTECGYDIEKPVVRVVNGEMAEWLLREGRLMDQIGHMQGSAPCAMEWKRYIARKGVTDTVNDISKKLPEVKQTEEKVRTQTKTAFAEVTKIVDQKIKELAGPKLEDTGGATQPGAGRADDSAPGDPVAKPPGPGSAPQVPASPVLPARPQAPPAGDTGQGESADGPGKGQATSTGTGPGPGQQPPPPPPPRNASADAQNGKKADHAETLVYLGTSSGADDDCDNKPKDSGPDKKPEAKDATAEGPGGTEQGGVGPSTPSGLSPAPGQEDVPPGQTAQPNQEGPKLPAPDQPSVDTTSVTTVTGTNDGGSEDPSVTGPDQDTTGQGSAVDGASDGATGRTVDGGNDDPPPLNPLKPKPNPNPDQAGSSGEPPAAGGGSGGGGMGGDLGQGTSSGPGATGHHTPSPVASPGGNNVQSNGSNATNANTEPGVDLDFKPHAHHIRGGIWTTWNTRLTSGDNI
ncbi:hypothetical protein AK88_05587 [Plasmodium fragile]|uniref:Schizont-infected cell agglutination extracellular alpha domain-containing protein n=1 Tax=Plasmodium fragile TaxID=5857 RepID=A0A0D9QGE0_PLAFR|nr:uncharacterized protein AK88_05587 [Plasmodium fragile]KJP84781.1 hypothetical protein AK88_05587 [Plasmodium fragile]